MSWGLVAVGVGTAVAGVAGSKASKDAASKQAAAAGDANALQWEMYQQQREDQAPWRNAGSQALNQLVAGISGIAPTRSNFDAAAYVAAHPNVLKDDRYKDDPFQHYLDYGQNIGYDFTPTAAAQAAGKQGGDLTRSFTLADFQKDPGYDFRLNQGLDAVQGSRAARGSMLSGSALKALEAYGSDYASSEYGKAYDRFNNDQTTRFNRLATIAGVGQNATNNVGTAGSNYANQAAGNLVGAGNAAAAGTVGSANAYTGAVNNLSSLYQLSQIGKTPTGGAGYSGSVYGGSGAANYGTGNAGYGNYSQFYGSGGGSTVIGG